MIFNFINIMIHILLKISLIHIIQQFIESMDLHGSIMGSYRIPGSLGPCPLLQVAKVPTLIKPKKISMIPMRITYSNRDHLVDHMGSRIREKNQHERTNNGAPFMIHT